MHRSLSSDALSNILYNRPALMKSVIKIDYKTFIDAVNRNFKIFNYMTSEQKATLLTKKSLRYLLKKVKKQKWCHDAFFLYFPDEIKNEIGPSIKDTEYVKYFPTAPYKLWKEFISGNTRYIDFNSIPENYRDREMRLTFLIHHDLDIVALSEDLIEDLIRAKPEIINKLPELYLTKDRLELALNSATEPLGLNNEFKEYDLWDEALVYKAVKAGEPLRAIPEKFITRDVCLEAVKKNGACNLSEVPKKFIDKELLCAGLVKEYGNDPDMIPYSFMGKSFLIQLAEAEQATNPDGKLPRIRAYLKRAKDKDGFNPKYFSEKWWPEVIKACPKTITLLEKTDQTDEVIKVFLTSAPIETIDRLADTLNLGKLKKPEYVGFYTGTTSPLIQSILSQLLNSEEETETDSNVIDLTNAEFRELQRFFK